MSLTTKFLYSQVGGDMKRVGIEPTKKLIIETTAQLQIPTLEIFPIILYNLIFKQGLLKVSPFIICT